MSTSSFTEFNLPRNAYAAFDAISLKQLITNRLKTSGLFPDIDYEGSNVNGLIDVVAYTYHVLLFYLNQTASDSLFSQAELFENMNKIVSLIGYKPNGNNTSSLNVSVSADESLLVGSYIIPRFSNISIKGIDYSINSDITFQKSVAGQKEFIESIGTNNLLYQGVFKEYPTYTAIGENFEQFTLNITYPSDVAGTKIIDHNNIFVFVKNNNTQVWSEWKEISSLYLADSISDVFEKRLNEYGHQEIKFGNNINGKKLNTGDSVVIYYLESDGNAGSVGSNAAVGGKMVLYSTPLFNEIYNNIKDPNKLDNYLIGSTILTLSFDNKYASVPSTYIETVDEIRKNAPLIFSAQNRAVTVYDYESFVSKNFSNIVQSVKAVSNKDYTKDYLSYFYEIGLEKPNSNDKVLFNQVSFNDACDFNNVYLFCVPRLGAIINEITPIELFFSQKQAIVDKLDGYKMVGHNVVVCDPIYLAFDIGLPIVGESITSDIRNETKIRITRSSDQLISKDQIKSSVYKLIKEFFSQTNNELNQILNFNELSFNILNIAGVKNVETVRTSNLVEYKVSKLNFIYFNPLYTSIVNSTGQNVSLKFFQFPFFYEISNLINKIEIV
jgi:hypothetical protein